MRKYLMHRDIPVALIDIESGVNHILKIYNKEHFPVGVTAHGYDDIKWLEVSLTSWERSRQIPAVRQNLAGLERIFGLTITEALSLSFKVSLTDTYWFLPEEFKDEVTWKDVNFYDNGFSAELACHIFAERGRIKVETPPSFNNPDMTTDGMLEKAWAYENGIPILLKRGELGSLSQKYCRGKNLLSANEVAASLIAKTMKVPAVPYKAITVQETGEVISGCPSFIQDENTDFVTTMQLQRQYGIRMGQDTYDFYVNKLHMQKEINRMILFVHLIHDADKHDKNFGILRNASTLETMRFAPLFDHGSSFGYSEEQETVKPFLATRMEQLRLLNEIPKNTPSKREIANLIKKAYELFDIPEIVYDKVLQDLDVTYKMFDEVIREKELHFDNEQTQDLEMEEKNS